MGPIDERWYERPPDVKEHVAAGGVVARVDDAGHVLVALAREDSFETPVLPKGHVNPGETVEGAARREIEEETGLSDLVLLAELGTLERLNFRRTQWKTTHYFLFGTRQVDAVPTDPRHPLPMWRNLQRLPEVFWPEQQELLVDNRARIRDLVLAWHAGGAERPPA